MPWPTSTRCPDIVLEVEVTNVGCTTAPYSPLKIEFAHPLQEDIEDDLGPIPPSVSLVAYLPVLLIETPMEATAIVDEADGVFECSEDATGGSAFCSEGIVDSMTRELCTCRSSPNARVALPRELSCQGEPILVDAGTSTVELCTWGEILYRFLDRHGRLLRDWSSDPTFEIAPDLCPSLFDYSVEVACSTEMAPECVDAEPFQVECSLDLEPPALGDRLRLRKEGGEILVDFPVLAGTYGDYELVGIRPAPCSPTHAPTPDLSEVAPVLERGDPPFRRRPGSVACRELSFFKVRGTSGCTGRQAPLCDGTPGQALPCP